MTTMIIIASLSSDPSETAVYLGHAMITPLGQTESATLLTVLWSLRKQAREGERQVGEGVPLSGSHVFLSHSSKDPGRAGLLGASFGG